MGFIDTLRRVRALLEEEGRVSLRALERELGVAGDELEELVDELVEIQQVATREGRALVWRGSTTALATAPVPSPERDPRDYTPAHLADRILHSRSALEGERKRVTVLFADVKGSMELAEELDPEAWHAILDRFFQILAEGVHRFEGTVNQYTGDGIMALFGAPIAHEDHAKRACYAALSLRDALRGYANEVRTAHGLSFSVRMGLNSGEVVVGRIGDDLRMDYTAQGHTVGLAARLQELAEPGTPTLTEATASLVRGYFELEDLGETNVKGSREPVRVLALTGLGAARTRLDVSRTRGFSKFVGRGTETQTLEAALEHALEGRGQVVGVVAEAGIGKSRLCFEFTEACHLRGIPVRATTGVAHGVGIPFLPILQYYRESFGIGSEDTARVARQKVAGALVLLEEGLRESLPLIFDFLGIADAETEASVPRGENRQRQLTALLQRIILARSEIEPAVLLFEDLHWFDSGSEALLEGLIEVVAGTRTLLVANYRPEYRADWMHRSYVQQLALQPLDAEAIGELLADLLGPDPSLAGLHAEILARTAGNPFFTEEVVRSLVEGGVLEGARGHYRLARSSESLRIPPAVQGVLAARIDRLEDDPKSALQAAAVIGSEFSEPLLLPASGQEPGRLSAALAALVEGEFVYETALFPEREYAFKHPLTREVAYESQLQSRRAEIHAHVAEALALVHAERLDENAALIAQHWEGAGHVENAAEWHRRAADWAGVGAPRESAQHWQRVRALSDALPESPERDALGVRARTGLLNLGGRVDAAPEEMAVIYREGDALAVRIGDDRARAQLSGAYSQYRVMTDANPSQLIAPLTEAVELADRSGSVAFQVASRYRLGMSFLILGRGSETLRMAEEGLARLREDPAGGSAELGFPATAAFHMFEANAHTFDERFDAANAAVERMRSGPGRDHPLVRFMAATAAATLAQTLGDVSRAFAAARELADCAETSGNAALLITASWNLCDTHGMEGDWEEAVRHGELGLERLRGGHAALNLEARIEASLARAYLGRGEPERARALAEQALVTLREIGVEITFVDLHLVLARAALQAHGPSEAARIEKELAQALAFAEARGRRLPLAQVLEVRAELAAAIGDGAGRGEHLRAAQAIYADVGATGHARRVEAVLAEGGGGP